MSDAIKSKGVSLRAIFDPYQPGSTKARASGIFDAGSDLSDEYANIIYGSAAAATGIKSEGADLNTLYAALGSSNHALPFNGKLFFAQCSGAVSPVMDANITVQIKSDGTYSITCAGNGTVSPSTSGTWLPAGQSASDYQVEYVWSQRSQYPTGPATVTNDAPTFQACTTTRQLIFDAQVGQFTGLDKGSVGDIDLYLKRISTGAVSLTAFSVDVESAGSG